MKNSTNLCRLFCCYYAKLGNVREAAVKAGFPPETALCDGLKILGSRKNRALIEKLMSDTPSAAGLVKAGLERLAFGSSNDAAFLAFSEEIPCPEKIAGLDLFGVSEIKRVKGGGVEIKLFDRQKALERLYEYDSQKDSSENASNLIRALKGMEAADGDEI